jgi:hypothetical protein
LGKKSNGVFPETPKFNFRLPKIFLVMNPMMMNMMMSNMMNMYMNNPKMQEMLAMQMMNQGGPNQSMSHSGSQQQILNGSHFSLPQIKQT